MRTPATAASTLAFVRSLLLLLLLVVVAPWLLVVAARERFGGPSPLHSVAWPTTWNPDRVWTALASRLTDRTIADVVIRLSLLIAWAAIAVIVITVVAEVVHMTRHHGIPMPEVRGLGRSQSVARVIASGLLVLAPLFGSSPRAIARDGVHLVARPTATAPAADDTGSIARSPRRVLPHPGPAGSGATGDLDATPLVEGRYVVRQGDSIFGIAVRLAGPDPRAIADYADRLIDLNLGLEMPDGRRFENAALIDVGWVLELPDQPGRHEPPSTVTTSTHTVQPGDTLWSIADDRLGDAERWREIFDDNVGRTFQDGRRLSTPDLIQPGWELLLQAPDATTPDVPPTAANDPTAEDSSDEPSHGRPRNVWVDRSTLRQREPAATSEAGPTAPLSAPETRGALLAQTDAAVSLSPTVGGTTARSDALNPAPVGSGGRSDASGSLLGVGRAAMLSAGALVLLAVRRRQRLRGARPRARLPAINPHREGVERALRSIDAGDRPALVDAAIRSVARPLIAHDARIAAVVVAHDGGIELRTDRPLALSTPWEGSGCEWWLPAPASLELLADQMPAAAQVAPALVQLGCDPSGREVYVDLEALEALEILGPDGQADAVVRAVAATLATSVAAEVTTLIGVGVDDRAFFGHRRHVGARDAAAAFEAARTAAGSTASQRGSTLELRILADSSETWEPAIVFIGSSVGAASPPARHLGLAVVSASPIDGLCSRLAPDGDSWMLRPAGVRLTPIGLSSADLEPLADLLNVVEFAPLPGGDRQHRGNTATTIDDDLTIVPRIEGDGMHPATGSFGWSILVRVLGPVDVVDHTGASVAFERSKTRELVAWLATHRERSTRSAARTALWEIDVRDATFANVVSEARRALARLVDPPEGEEWVGRTMTEALPLHEHVRTDAELVAHALETARCQPSRLAVLTLEPAVGWITGLPFAGTSYVWPDAEGITSNLVLLATSAAVELAAHHLSMGDIDGVFRATGRGLLVLPGHEELIGLRMRAHALTGDHAGVRHEWDSYQRVVNADPWSDGEPSPKLVELRRTLLDRSR